RRRPARAHRRGGLVLHPQHVRLGTLGPAHGGGLSVTVALPTGDAPCFICGRADAHPLWATPDRAFAGPGFYTVAPCGRCGFLYQRPRVRDEHLAACYPDHYPRHQEPSPRLPFKGSKSRQRAARWALAVGLGYEAFRDARVSLLTRLRARRMLRRIRWS